MTSITPDYDLRQRVTRSFTESSHNPNLAGRLFPLVEGLANYRQLGIAKTVTEVTCRCDLGAKRT